MKVQTKQPAMSKKMNQKHKQSQHDPKRETMNHKLQYIEFLY